MSQEKLIQAIIDLPFEILNNNPQVVLPGTPDGTQPAVEGTILKEHLFVDPQTNQKQDEVLVVTPAGLTLVTGNNATPLRELTIQAGEANVFFQQGHILDGKDAPAPFTAVIFQWSKKKLQENNIISDQSKNSQLTR